MLQDLPTQIGSIVNQWLSHFTIPFHVCHFWRAFVWLYVCSIGQMSASSLGMAWAPKWWTMFDLSSRIWSKFSNKGVNATDNVLVCKWVADRWHGPLWAGYRGSLCSGLIMQILLGQKISELMSSFAHLGSANMASLSQEIIDFEQTLLLFLGPKLPDFLWHSANSCIDGRSSKRKSIYSIFSMLNLTALQQVLLREAPELYMFEIVLCTWHISWLHIDTQVISLKPAISWIPGSGGIRLIDDSKISPAERKELRNSCAPSPTRVASIPRITWEKEWITKRIRQCQILKDLHIQRYGWLL